jgi:hypothetical protein
MMLPDRQRTASDKLINDHPWFPENALAGSVVGPVPAVGRR